MTEQIVFGMHAVQALLTNPFRTIKKLYINAERHDKRMQMLLEHACHKKVIIEELSLAQLNQHFPNLSHQGVVALAHPLAEYHEKDLANLLALSQPPYFILILDGVTDPHNLGACLRSADGAGVNLVIIPKDNSASLTPTVSKVACGAAESVPLVRVTNLARVMDYLKEQGIWLYGAAGEAKQLLYQVDCRTSVGVVLGAEEKGLRRLTRERCDGLFALPMYGSVSSLNVSVATGISLYEVVRQRHLHD